MVKKHRSGFFVVGAFAAEIPGSYRNNAAGWLFVAEGGNLVANNSWLQKTLEFEIIMMFNHYPTPDSILEMVIDMCGYVLWKSLKVKMTFKS